MSIVYSAAALADLAEIEDDLNQVGSHVVGLFHSRLKKSLETRELFPLSAEEYEPPDPRFPGLRFFPIRRFEMFAV